MKALVALLAVLFVPAANAAPKLFMTCTRDAKDFHYDLQVYVQGKWNEVNSKDTIRYIWDILVTAQRIDSKGKKSVRNYSNSSIYIRPFGPLTIDISLSKKNTIYGDLRVVADRKLNVKSAKLSLDAEGERVLDLDCKLVR